MYAVNETDGNVTPVVTFAVHVPSPAGTQVNPSGQSTQSNDVGVGVGVGVLVTTTTSTSKLQSNVGVGVGVGVLVT
ncbi:MAG: hypothetical protein ACRC2J_17870, partial [Microcoleaceae cyanobacterium]